MGLAGYGRDVLGSFLLLSASEKRESEEINVPAGLLFLIRERGKAGMWNSHVTARIMIICLFFLLFVTAVHS